MMPVGGQRSDGQGVGYLYDKALYPDLQSEHPRSPTTILRNKPKS